MFAAARRMKVPCTQYVLANANMPQICMIRLELSLASWIVHSTDTNAAVSFTGKPITEFHFKIGNVRYLVFQIALPVIAIAHDAAIANGPCFGVFRRRYTPAVERLAVKNFL